MKVVAVIAGLFAGAYFVDSQFYHGRYFRAAGLFTQQVTTYTGLR
jgi:hypothetical protein